MGGPFLDLLGAHIAGKGSSFPNTHGLLERSGLFVILKPTEQEGTRFLIIEERTRFF